MAFAEQLESDQTEPELNTSAVSFQELLPLPHKIRSTSNRKRPVGHAQCLTSSPYKLSLETAIPSTSKAKASAKGKPEVSGLKKVQKRQRRCQKTWHKAIQKYVIQKNVKKMWLKSIQHHACFVVYRTTNLVLSGGSATCAATGPVQIVRVSIRKIKDLFACSVPEKAWLRPTSAW